MSICLSDIESICFAPECLAYLSKCHLYSWQLQPDRKEESYSSGYGYEPASDKVKHFFVGFFSSAPEILACLSKCNLFSWQLQPNDECDYSETRFVRTQCVGVDLSVMFRC